MSYSEGIRIVRGSKRFIGGVDKDVSIPYALEAQQLNLIEGDRNKVLDLSEQFLRERDSSSIYRFYGKISPLYENFLTGCTEDTVLMQHHMEFTSPHPNTATTTCGYPSFEIFDFVPSTGFTNSSLQGSPNPYEEQLAYQYNWTIYESYVYSADTEEKMHWVAQFTPPNYQILQFTAHDGIPFTVNNVQVEGKNLLKCTCPVEHGLNVGEYILLADGTTNNAINQNLVTIINGDSLVPVYSLGDATVGSDTTIFNILLDGSSNVPPNFSLGNFKRVINPDNLEETTSQYYVHQHKLITTPRDYILDNCAFELGIYDADKKVYCEHDSPPNGIPHKVTKQEYRSFLWNFTNDLNTSFLSDNLNRPITEIYTSIFVTNYYNIWDQITLLNSQPAPYLATGSSPAGYGWSWNFQPNGTLDSYPSSHPTNLQTPTTYPTSGDTFRGAYAEYNPSEVKERVVSEIYHKLQYNLALMDIGIEWYPATMGGQWDHPPPGYYYQPHNRMITRKYSNQISTNPDYNYAPPYAYYSVYENTFKWRNILDLGYYESETNGVNYPFLNGIQYVYNNIMFNIKPLLGDLRFRGATSPIEIPDFDDCQ